MEDTMKVLKLLEELEDIVDDATGLPLSNKIMVDAEEIFQDVYKGQDRNSRRPAAAFSQEI